MSDWKSMKWIPSSVFASCAWLSCARFYNSTLSTARLILLSWWLMLGWLSGKRPIFLDGFFPAQQRHCLFLSFSVEYRFFVRALENCNSTLSAGHQIQFLNLLSSNDTGFIINTDGNCAPYQDLKIGCIVMLK